ncbi:MULTISPECIES: hypothetical protein [unclassified Serratia (in: enterobacteria)]|uniref:hypothetical protein n=1 Tax=unclassified Serratia (in: enterobacteria) TaxID=2647522 RepID=UPI0004682B10|nr:MULTISPECIES: hypothetical protein [unclassified Serratia (in: enterobacteria)]
MSNEMKINKAQLSTRSQRIIFHARIVLAQMLNILLAGSKILITALYVMPCAFFWLLVSLIIFFPQLFTEMMSVISHISTAEEAMVVLQATFGPQGTAARFLLVTWILWTVLRLVMGWNPGFRNCWRDARNRELQD